MKLTHKQQVVLDLINKYPKAADSDPILLDRYWHEVDHYDDTKSLFWNLEQVTPPGSITRARRKLHEYGYIKYSKDIENKRYEAMQDYQDEHGSHYERVAAIVQPKPKYHLALIGDEEVMVLG